MTLKLVSNFNSSQCSVNISILSKLTLKLFDVLISEDYILRYLLIHPLRNLLKQIIRVLATFRSSRLEVFCKIGALRNFPKFTGKHLCQSLFLNKVAETLVQVLSLGFCAISKNNFSYRISPLAASAPR